jgi:redox-sensitive bicupin YhaK (pirin superfamily)
MLMLRKAEERFHTKIDWLDSWHSFSFGEHHDAKHMGFGSLRVINEDRIKGGAGFPTHGHRDMEIITIVLEGALAHKDNTDIGAIIKPGDVQKMSAGSGILHSEFNALPDKECHLLQIWIMPNVKNVAPAYKQISFAPEKMRNQFCLVASDSGKEDVITLYQDASILITNLDDKASLDYKIAQKRNVWVQLAEGAITVNEIVMEQGDGLAVTNETSLSFSAQSNSKIVLFDMGD